MPTHAVFLMKGRSRVSTSFILVATVRSISAPVKSAKVRSDSRACLCDGNPHVLEQKLHLWHALRD